MAPRDAIRALAAGVFDAIDARPWVGGQLSRDPWQYAVLRILEGVGGQIQALGVPEHARFNAATALLSFILGLAGQYAAGARVLPQGSDRAAFLGAVAARWLKLDPAQHPFVRQVATQLPGHDDRQQFLAGIDLILVGIEHGAGLPRGANRTRSPRGRGPATTRPGRSGAETIP